MDEGREVCEEEEKTGKAPKEEAEDDEIGDGAGPLDGEEEEEGEEEEAEEKEEEGEEEDEEEEEEE